MDVKLVVAFDYDYGIGKNNNIPWKCPPDMKIFVQLTKGHIVIMGRKTYESIGKPLVGRVNIVISKELINNNEGIIVCASIDDALKMIREDRLYIGKTIWGIGGEKIYTDLAPYANHIHTTYIRGSYDCDVFFDKSIIYNPLCEEVHRQDLYENDEWVAQYVVYKRSNKYDDEYLDAVKKVLLGTLTKNRTGIDTYQSDPITCTYDLSLGIPILTSKYVNYKNVINELIWMLKGRTDNKYLNDRGVHIWDANSSREFLDSRGLDYPEGELGPVYGYQMRHFGGNYPAKDGVDQIAQVIDQIKNDPTSRRIIISLWNPADIDKMALPPCHLYYQFTVVDGVLHSCMVQRSADMGLGVPYNIVFTSILTYIFANICELQVGKFTHVMVNPHIYENHVDALMTQLWRPTNQYPKLRINRLLTSVDDLELEDFDVYDYVPGDKLHMKMAV
jgi:dihydrofolate reductase / thymidylate synthase